MVATSDCAVKSKPIAEKKASKPLMEKKRRARINKCLDQLKYLLENYYTSNIRKRKLEKADILELTVKHLRNLQKIQSSSSTASELPDYQAGFRSCLASVNEYLLMADNNSNGGDRLIWSHLSHNLRCAKGPGTESASSTLDSDLSASVARESVTRESVARESTTQQRRLLSAAGHGTTRVPLGGARCSGALRPHGAATDQGSHPLLRDVKEKLGPMSGSSAPTDTQEKASPNVCHNNCLSVKGSGDDVGGISSVWRPWS